ncbi:mitochondrial processing peptidase [Cryptococcus bacillisporus CA1873]|uniref:Alpha-MPP n=1 Tax=Cryptococcus bacillisporus CA1873 TaxID=1296111 RepID=A0ABR5B645_CRYGA|nr:mitochondrial processing peptidase [Cryptococcus bacillisporus CA1873]|eukprot:KIR58819.1 mitochondrial processing peptidase [Cryptococcus gattii CA1873]
MIRIPAARRLASKATASSSLLVPSRRATTAATSSAHTLNPAGTVTTLPNKLRVATESIPGHFHAVGVYIDAGSRYESQRTSGVSHLLDRLAFKSTDKHTDAQMTTLIDSLGSQVTCASSRETIMYQSTVFPQSLPLALELISSTIRHPLLLPEELVAQKEAAAYEIREIWAKPELILPEISHTVAFKDNTLGMPLLCPESQLGVLGEEEVRGFMRDWYRPERMVVAGVGMPHEELVMLAEKFFGDMPTTTTTAGSLHPSVTQAQQHLGSKSFATASALPVSQDYTNLAHARARYTGGELYMEKPEEEFVHIHIGFEGLGIHDPDIYALATLQTLLGGGGSFSAGGPGKGMYTRLYTKVLNQYHAVDFCSAFHHCYADSGLFGISASLYPQFASRIVDVMAGQLHALTGPMFGGVEEKEVKRAKNMLKSTLVMALESRLTAVEDLGRQVQIHGHKVPVEDMCAKIDALTMADLHRVANRILRPGNSSEGRLNYGLGSGKATVVAQGPGLGALGDVRRILKDRWMLGV